MYECQRAVVGMIKIQERVEADGRVSRRKVLGCGTRRMGCYGVNRGQTSGGGHYSCVGPDLLPMVSGWRRLGAHFRLLRANVGINANVVVCELAHLSVVDTDNLGLLRRTEAEARDKVHNPEDDGSDDKGVAHARGRIGELITDLDPVAVDPATVNGCEAIEESDLLLGKDAG